MTDMDPAIAEQLSNIFLLRPLDSDRVRTVLSSSGCTVRTFSSGSTIYSPDQFDRALCVLLSGKARVTRNGTGARKVLLRELCQGDVIGAASLFGNDVGYVTTVTARGAVTAAFFSQSLCTDIVTSCPAAAVAYIRFLSDRIRFLNDRISSFTVSSAEKRVAQLLLRPDSGAGNGSPCNLKILASSLNIGRATLYRVLDSFSEHGWIEKTGTGILVRDPAALYGVLAGNSEEKSTGNP